jgi:HEAT repeat protein
MLNAEKQDYLEIWGRRRYATLAKRSSSVIDKLLTQLENGDSILRENAAYLLGEMALEAQALTRSTLKNAEQLAFSNELTNPMVADKVKTSLTRALTDPEPWVRGNAADALGKMGDVETIPAIAALMCDQDNIVRQSAAEALRLINDDACIPFLIDALRDSEWSVRLSAVKALETVRDDQVIKALMSGVKDPNPDVRSRCETAVKHHRV